MANTDSPALPDLLRFSRPSDDLEAQASLAADLEETRRAASLLGEADAFVRAACLLGAADRALTRGETPWALLDAAEREVTDLRLEHGCEDWPSADWSQATVQDVALLHDTCVELRRQARALRDARLPSLRRAG